MNICSYLILNSENAGVYKELVTNLSFLNYVWTTLSNLSLIHKWKKGHVILVTVNNSYFVHHKPDKRNIIIIIISIVLIIKKVAVWSRAELQLYTGLNKGISTVCSFLIWVEFLENFVNNWSHKHYKHPHAHNICLLWLSLHTQWQA